LNFLKPIFRINRLSDRIFGTNNKPSNDMKTNIARISLLTLIAAALIAVPAATSAQDAGTNSATAPAKAKKAKATLPFNGAVTAVDTNAVTFAVGERTFNVTSATKITKSGQPAVLGDLTVGETVTGAYKKSADGKLDATSVKIGGKKKKDATAATK
jgi:hypothetical protein